jgi:hypothetical protein
MPVGRVHVQRGRDGYESVVEALQSNTVVQVRVDQQTYKQVLFVGISVLPAG